MLFWLAGLYFGWRWASEPGPAWRHALQVLFTMLAAMSAVRLVQRWRSRHNRAEGVFGSLPLYGLFLVKLALVASALAVEYLLQRWIPPQSARTIVGAGLGVAFATIGPVLHRRHNSLRPQVERRA
ncbi:hypothetical protein [Streptomyces sp. NBC_00893]|uniref:hypothetical protein n=1 Tax=Streptomyces sp. NBC_00893 TaxID=2975862 RepID=UPI0022584EC2|nr:hypothetical protein [Streptomyces sp. NBC_00893]MCX4851968.1 hypothetical protein [Streptomyces sp. NBC_00893]